jgi:tRNA(Ile)-lysidine synthase
VGPHPAVAVVRRAVRQSLAGLAPGDLVLVGCSGGPDSLALAAAAGFEAPRAGLRAGAVVVDHGLQPGSAELTGKVAAVLAGLDLKPVLTPAVSVASPGAEGYQGPEAAARSARYAALTAAAAGTGAAAVLLGHTLDDQAETVLLGLARGSGPRSLAGMAESSGPYLRPFLQVRRAQTRAACVALGLEPWDDPQNRDPAFTRVRVRMDLMPALEATLGPGVAEALARTACMLRADADALDQIATAEAARAQDEGAGWLVAELAPLPDAIRHRILRAAALAAGCPAGALGYQHVASLDALVVGWRGQRWADLPGGIRCQRRYGRLLFTTTVLHRHGSPGSSPLTSPPSAVTAPRSEDPGGRE